MPDALDRAAGEQARNAASSSRDEVGQRGRREIGPRLQLGLARRLRELVPGADGEAIVAAVDAVADRGRNARRSWPWCSIVR